MRPRTEGALHRAARNMLCFRGSWERRKLKCVRNTRCTLLSLLFLSLHHHFMEALALPRGEDGGACGGVAVCVLAPTRTAAAAPGKLRGAGASSSGGGSGSDVRITFGDQHTFATLEFREAASFAKGPAASTQTTLSEVFQKMPRECLGVCFLGKGLLASLGLGDEAAREGFGGARVRIESVPFAYRTPHISRITLQPCIGATLPKAKLCPASLARKKLMGRILDGDMFVALPDISTGERLFRICSVEVPSQAKAGRFASTSDLLMLPGEADKRGSEGSRGGDADSFDRSLWPTLEYCMIRNILTERTGCSPCALLISGPSGCGKKSIVRSLCQELGEAEGGREGC